MRGAGRKKEGKRREGLEERVKRAEIGVKDEERGK